MTTPVRDARGFAFPFRIDPATGGVQWASGSEKIRQNIRLILSVRQGERPMLRDFGSGIHGLVQDPNDAVLAEMVKRQAQAALLAWEPRILVTGTEVEYREGELAVRLIYTHTTEPVVDSMILPLA